jgi:hypothetical protein
VETGFKESRFWRIYKDGLDCALLYGSAFLVCVGVHLVAPAGYDLIAVGLCLFALRRDPLALRVVLYNGDADDGVPHTEDDKQEIQIAPEIAPRMELVLVRERSFSKQRQNHRNH